MNWLLRHLLHSNAGSAWVGALLVLLVGVADYSSGYELSLGAFYLFPVFLVAWVAGKTGGVLIALFSAVVWLAADWAAGYHYSNQAIAYWNAAVRLGFFLAISLLAARLRMAQDKQERRPLRSTTAFLPAEFLHIAMNTQADVCRANLSGARFSHLDARRAAAEEVYMRFRLCFRLVGLLLFLFPSLCRAQTANRVIILYDAFGKSPALTRDWGFSAWIEHGGKNVLFDTGNNAEIFAANVKALGVDLRKLDFVVISHRHADHASGLAFLLKVNPTVKIYAPDEPFGLFGRGVPNDFYRTDDSLPASRRYFGGQPPKELSGGSPWPHANFVPVSTTTQVAPGIFVIPTISQMPGTLELRELSLAIRSPEGLIVVDGCSHAGVEKILEAASKIDPHIHILFGGLHLIKAPDQEIARMAAALHDQWKLDSIAPGHCTGEPTFTALQKAFGDRYVYAGLGTVVGVP